MITNLMYKTTNYADGRASEVRKYYYGLDLLGSVYGSVGTGGLRMIEIDGALCYAFNNQIGSIEALYGTDSNTASALKAEYLYSAYGELLMKSGDLADKNNITYSTRYQEANTGLVSYTYRHYAPRLHKWINKDLIAEHGGLNLYQMIANQPINYWDILGLLSGNAGNSEIRKTIKSYIKDILEFPCLGVIIVAHGIDGESQFFGIPGTANEVLNDLQSFASGNGRTPTNLGLGAASCNDILSNQAAGAFGYPNANRTDQERNNMPFNIYAHLKNDPDNLRAALSKEIKALKSHAIYNMCNKEPNCCDKINIKIFTIVIDQRNFYDNYMDAINYFKRNYPFLKDDYEYGCDEL